MKNIKGLLHTYGLNLHQYYCNAHLPFHFTAMQTYSFETETSEIACTLAGKEILSLNLLERKV